MPVYAYACVKHGQFEKLLPMKDAGLQQQCPTCRSLCPREYLPVTVVSDATLFTGDRLGQVDGAVDGSLIGDHYRALARKAGIVTHGRQYMSGLARYPGDPEAWVGDRADVVRVAKKNNFSVEGMVSVKNEREAPAEKGLAQDVAQRLVTQKLMQNPGMSADRAMADVIDQHAPRGGKRIIKKKQRRAVPVPKIPKTGRENAQHLRRSR